MFLSHPADVDADADEGRGGDHDALSGLHEEGLQEQSLFMAWL